MGVLERARNPGTNYIAPAPMAISLVCAGEHEEAIRWLQKAYADPYEFSRIRVSPVYDPLRSDPRFQELLRKTGLDR